MMIEEIGEKIDNLETKADHLEVRFDELDNGIDTLALSCQREFKTIHEETAEMKEKIATKQDLYQMEARILNAFKDAAIEIKNLNTRVLVLEGIVKP
jgi:hypothetical protein